MKRLARLGTALAALAAAGCDFAPAYKPPNVAVPTHFKEGGTWRIAQPGDMLPRGAWWTAFKDRTLDGLEPQVDEANQTLVVAYGNYQLARTQVQQAQASLYPTLDQQSQLTTNRQSDHRTYRGPLPDNEYTYYGDNRVAIQSSYEVDLWGRVRDTIKANAAEAQSQAALLESVRLSLHAQLARTYVALRGVDRDLKLLRETTKSRQDALTLTQERLAGKIASPMDVERAKAELEVAKALADEDMVRRAALEHSIATLIGKPASAFSIPISPVVLAMPRGPKAAPSTLLERRPDIAAAERQVAAANEGIGIAKTAFYPRFFINLYAGTQDRGVRLLDLANELYTIGPSVTIPIFDGGARDAQLKAAYARREQTAAQYRQTILVAVQEVEDALAAQYHLARQSQRLDSAVTAETKVLALALTLYRDGATSYLDVVTAQQALLAQQRSTLAVLNSRLDAAVALFVALGGGWTPEVAVAER